MGWITQQHETGVRLHGRLAEVWDDAGQAGVLLSWEIRGHAGEWQGMAEGYRLVRLPSSCSVRFPLFARHERILELTGQCALAGEIVADDTSRDDPVTLKGWSLEVRDERAL